MREDGDKCIYCGSISFIQREHVIPVAFLGWRSYDSDLQWIVAACRDCNKLASSAVFFSIPEKAAYIKTRYERKFRKLIDMPHWTEDELNEMRC